MFTASDGRKIEIAALINSSMKEQKFLSAVQLNQMEHREVVLLNDQLNIRTFEQNEKVVIKISQIKFLIVLENLFEKGSRRRLMKWLISKAKQRNV